MEKHYHRRPVGNFFILPSLQFGLIKKIVAAVLLSTFVCIGSMLLLYWITYRSVAFYRVILDASMDISSRENIIFILLPSLAIAAVVNVVIGFFIGMYASRKYAVPIYKLEQWIGFLNEGKFTAQLQFREKREMKELTMSCNSLAYKLRNDLLTIRSHTDNLLAIEEAKSEAVKIDEILATMELDSDPIEVHTQYYKVGGRKKGHGE